MKEWRDGSERGRNEGQYIGRNRRLRDGEREREGSRDGGREQRERL